VHQTRARAWVESGRGWRIWLPIWQIFFVKQTTLDAGSFMSTG